MMEGRREGGREGEDCNMIYIYDIHVHISESDFKKLSKGQLVLGPHIKRIN